MADVVQTSSSVPTTASAGDEALSEWQRTGKVDVWSRWGRVYRTRAFVLLFINVLLFAGVGQFAFWLRSGEVFAPAMEGYFDQLALTFRFTGDPGVSLGSLLVAPISVQDVPMQIPIVGLLMGALIAIPILVAILYRFWASLPFIAVVGFLAVMPWLAITLIGACIIASVRPFRTPFRFISALLGLAPVALYLTLAWKGTADVIVGEIDPIDRMKFIAPWVLAIVASVVVFAIVLSIARLVNHRPGTIAPLLTIMLVLPVAFFEFYVGRDELHYRLLRELDESHFAAIDATLPLRQAVRNAWERHPVPRPSWEAVRETEELKWQFALAADFGPFESELTRHQAQIVAKCDWFHRNFPDSRYIYNVLFIKARALDMRVDPQEFRRTKWIRFYDEFPSSASRETWMLIAKNEPDSVLGAVSLLRLAQIDAREGSVERAIDRLSRLLNTLAVRHAPTAAETQAGALSGVLSRAPTEAEFNLSVKRIELQANRLGDLLVRNEDPIYGYEPIRGPRRAIGSVTFGLADLDPRHEHYVANLKALRGAYPNCQIEDNIDLEIAKATVDLETRIALLEACVRRFARRDAIPEALYRLAVAHRDAGDQQASAATFTRLAEEFPKSYWNLHELPFVNRDVPNLSSRSRP